MKTAVAFPFRVAGDDRVSLLFAFSPRPNNWSAFDDWDADTSVAVTAEARLDVSGILADCALERSARLACALVWTSSGSTLRGRLASQVIPRLVEQTDVSLEGSVEGPLLAQSVDFTFVVHLRDAHNPSSQLAPSSAGAILWSRTQRITLEGAGGRFPIEVLRFRDAGYPPRAPWLLDWNVASPSDPFLGGVRLLVNRDHPACAVLTGADRSHARVGAMSLLRFDVGRQLIGSMLSSQDFVMDCDSYPEGSVGHHVRNLLALHFPTESVGALASTFASNPGHFEARLKAAIMDDCVVGGTSA
jgi:hypothetical protein